MKRAVNVLMLVLSLAFGLLVCECGIRLMYPRFANYNMEMWRYFAGMKMLVNRPGLPFVHFPSRSGKYYNVQVATNTMGFRDKEYPLVKPADTRRIVLVGDSQTMGWGVPAEKTFGKLLETRLNATGVKHEVINMGIGNYNSAMEANLFEWKGLPLNPDLVVLVFFINDMEPTPRLSRVSYEIARRSYLLAYLYDRYETSKTSWNKSFNWKDYYQSLYRPDAPAYVENNAALDRLAALCAKNGIKLLVVNYPELHQLKDYPFPNATATVKAFADRHKLPFVDLLPGMAPFDPPSLWVSGEDAHGNAKANAVAADLLFEPILDQFREKN